MAFILGRLSMAIEYALIESMTSKKRNQNKEIKN
tara:strand:- start:9225 stop:9326 length:102 start_codon:yes stop_codon:yes gene_type:complete